LSFRSEAKESAFAFAVVGQEPKTRPKKLFQYCPAGRARYAGAPHLFIGVYGQMKCMEPPVGRHEDFYPDQREGHAKL
jgi:hypothetical protein